MPKNPLGLTIVAGDLIVEIIGEGGERIRMTPDLAERVGLELIRKAKSAREFAGIEFGSPFLTREWFRRPRTESTIH